MHIVCVWESVYVMWEEEEEWIYVKKKKCWTRISYALVICAKYAIASYNKLTMPISEERKKNFLKKFIYSLNEREQNK